MSTAATVVAIFLGVIFLLVLWAILSINNDDRD